MISQVNKLYLDTGSPIKISSACVLVHDDEENDCRHHNWHVMHLKSAD